VGWLAAIALAASPFVVAIATERGNPTPVAGGQRFGSVGSNRYAYWRAAAHVWFDHPLEGAGPASFRAEWLKRRSFPETVRDAHSLEIETLAELGLVGFACFVLLFGGVAVALLRADPAITAGPAAALSVWAVHSGVDWDWEMPGLTLVAVALAGYALTLAQRARGA
jgi:O-antigen ligase